MNYFNMVSIPTNELPMTPKKGARNPATGCCLDVSSYEGTQANWQGGEEADNGTTFMNIVHAPKQTPKRFLRHRDRVTTAGNRNIGSNSIQHQSSQPFLKRFLVFDYSGGQWQILLHPAHEQDLSGSTRGIPSLPERSVPVGSANADTLTAYREALASAFATVQCMRNSRSSALAAVNAQDQPSNTYWEAYATELESAKSWSCPARGSPFSDGVEESCSHENTEDIDALLSSDDEVSSTGHSPPGEQFTSESEDSSNASQLQKRYKTSSDRECEQVNASPSNGDSSIHTSAAASIPGSIRLCNVQGDISEKQWNGQSIHRADSVEMSPTNSSAESQNMVMSYISSSVKKGRRREGL